MNGARFVHDTLEARGWDVLIACAQRVKGLAPLACGTDRIDARVLARSCLSGIWCRRSGCPTRRSAASASSPGSSLHLVRHRTSLKNRIHSTLIAFGKPCPVSDLFGVAGRELLASLNVPELWRGNVDASLVLIDDIDCEIATLTRELKRLGAHHRYVPLLMTAPGVGWLVGFSIATEIGDIKRFSSPRKLCGYTREGRAWPPKPPAASSGLDSS